MPVYFVTSGADLRRLAGLILISSIGAVGGTIVGTRILHHLPERVFRISVDILLVALGLFMLTRALRGN